MATPTIIVLDNSSSGQHALLSKHRELATPARSVSAPSSALSASASRASSAGGATPDSGLPPSAAPPSAGSRSLRAETSPVPARSGSVRIVRPAHSPLPTRARAASNGNTTIVGSLTVPYTTTPTADLENSGLVPELRIAKLRTRWGIPASDILVRVFPCVYKKPRPSHGKMYIFPNYLVFVSHSHHTNICIPFAEVEQVQRKRHRIHLITADTTHRLRGNLTNKSTVYEVLLAVWSHARGDTSINLASIRAGDKRVQKVVRRGSISGSSSSRRGSLTDTSEGTISEEGGLGSDDEMDDMGDDMIDSDEDDIIEESITIPKSKSAPTATASTNNNNKRWEIPLTPLDAVPMGFAATLVPPPDTQVVNRAGPVALKASLEHCWHLLFASDSENALQTMTRHNLKDIVLGEWVPDTEEPGVMTRTVKYSKPMQNVFVKGDAVVNQIQKAVFVRLPTKRVCLWQESHMQGVPYADSFVVRGMYELTEEPSGRATSVTNTAWVFWTKSPPRFLKGKIERGSVEGADESFKGVIANTVSYILAEARSSSPSPPPPTTTTTVTTTSSSSPSSTSTSSPLPFSSSTTPSTTNTTMVAVAMVNNPSPTMAVERKAGVHIDSKYVYAVVGVLLFSIITNVILAASRAG